MDQTIVVRRGDAASHQMSAVELILLDLDSGQYYLLEGVAGRVWQLLEERPCVIDEIARIITSEHEVTPELCRRDLLAFVEELAVAGLVEVQRGT